MHPYDDGCHIPSSTRVSLVGLSFRARLPRSTTRGPRNISREERLIYVDSSMYCVAGSRPRSSSCWLELGGELTQRRRAAFSSGARSIFQWAACHTAICSTAPSKSFPDRLVSRPTVVRYPSRAPYEVGFMLVSGSSRRQSFTLSAYCGSAEGSIYVHKSIRRSGAVVGRYPRIREAVVL